MFKALYNGPSGQNILTKNRGNNAIQSGGAKPMPQKFSPSTGSSSFSNARKMYSNNSGITPTSKERTSKERTFDGCNNDQSGYIQRKKMNAVGKGSMTTNNGPLAFSSANMSDTRSHLRQCRSGGCSAPAKKGANISYKSGGSSILSGAGNRTINS